MNEELGIESNGGKLCIPRGTPLRGDNYVQARENLQVVACAVIGDKMMPLLRY